MARIFTKEIRALKHENGENWCIGCKAWHKLERFRYPTDRKCKLLRYKQRSKLEPVEITKIKNGEVVEVRTLHLTIRYPKNESPYIKLYEKKYPLIKEGETLKATVTVDDLSRPCRICGEYFLTFFSSKKNFCSRCFTQKRKDDAKLPRSTFSPEQDEIIKQSYISDKKRGAIKATKLLPQRYEAILDRATKLGLRKRAYHRAKWGKKEISILQTYFYSSRSFIKSQLEREGFSRTLYAIGLKKAELKNDQDITFFTFAQLMSLFCVTRNQIYRWITENRLQVERVAGVRMVPVSSVKIFILSYPELSPDAPWVRVVTEDVPLKFFDLIDLVE